MCTCVVSIERRCSASLSCWIRSQHEQHHAYTNSHTFVSHQLMILTGWNGGCGAHLPSRNPSQNCRSDSAGCGCARRVAAADSGGSGDRSRTYPTSRDTEKRVITSALAIPFLNRCGRTHRSIDGAVSRQPRILVQPMVRLPESDAGAAASDGAQIDGLEAFEEARGPLRGAGGVRDPRGVLHGV